MDSKIFKAYDVRGVVPDQFDEEAAERIGRAYAAVVKPKRVVVGRDVRTHSPALAAALTKGLMSAGVDVVDIGVISTDMLYFAVATGGDDGGLMISASHNPREYNGIKMVRAGARAISSDTGLFAIRDVALGELPLPAATPGTVTSREIVVDYLNHVASLVNRTALKPLRVLANGNFGMAGTFVQQLVSEQYLPLQLTVINGEPDGTFPKGRPDPLIPENREEMVAALKAGSYDFGVAWDADADRCFFFTGTGEFIEGYYITALLARALLEKFPQQKIICDPRTFWAVRDITAAAGGTFLLNKCGHSFIKDRMRAEDALFAGENSAHYYFRDNFYVDNGLIPFLLIAELVSTSGKSLAELVAPLQEKYVVSGEINSTVSDSASVLARVRAAFPAGEADEIDGLSLSFPQWRFNLRSSNTEPLLRLNVEATNRAIMEKQRDAVLALIRQ